MIPWRDGSAYHHGNDDKFLLLPLASTIMMKPITGMIFKSEEYVSVYMIPRLEHYSLWFMRTERHRWLKCLWFLSILKTLTGLQSPSLGQICNSPVIYYARFRWTSTGLAPKVYYRPFDNDQHLSKPVWSILLG